MTLYQKLAACHLIGVFFVLHVNSVLISTPRDTVVQRGSTAVLMCRTVNSSQTVALSWYNSSRCRVVSTDDSCSMKYNYTANPNSRVHMTHFNRTSDAYILNIRQTELTDAGTYVCLDEISHVFASTYLTVVVGPPQCTHTTTQNNYVITTCQFTFVGNSAMPLTIMKNGLSVAVGNSTSVTWTGLASNNDSIVCQAAFGYQAQCPALHDIPKAPGQVHYNDSWVPDRDHHMNPQDPGAVGQGQPFGMRMLPIRREYTAGDVIRCSASGSYPITYTWYVDSIKFLLHGPDLHVTPEMADHDVQIECVAKNSFGKTQKMITATIVASVHQITFSPLKSLYEVGDHIKCKAKGYPKPIATWHSQYNAHNNAYSFNNESVLKVTEDMIGKDLTFTCTASNYVNGIPYHITETISFDVTRESGHVNPLVVILVIAVIVGIIVAIVILKKKAGQKCKRNRNHSSGATVGRPDSKDYVAASAPIYPSYTPAPANPPYPVAGNVYNQQGGNQVTAQVNNPYMSQQNAMQ